MKGLLLFSLATSFQNNNNDAIFNAWCSDVGIACPGAEVRTTPRSVAGRGVFSKKDLSKGECAISVPLYTALTQVNAAKFFPDLADELIARRTEKRSRLSRIRDRIRRRSARVEVTADDVWQAELTAYALEASAGEHPWSTWISQWKRDDPWQKLVDESTWMQEADGSIDVAVSDFSKMAPDVPGYKTGAAIGMRLQELDEYLEKYENSKVPTSASMYSTLISRAIGLSDCVTAILPMHDMINHSSNPNLGFTFFEDDESFKMIALEDISKDQELFLSYKDVNDSEGEWDEDKAAWLLVQWGIPSSPVEASSTSSSVALKILRDEVITQSRT